MNDLRPCKVVFFDLGDTLVVADSGWVRGAKDTLRALGDRDVRLGIISNTGDLARDQLARHLPDDFDFGAFEGRLILLSSEIGVEKPDPRIFKQAVERTRETDSDLTSSECLFCTEDLAHTLVAQSVGMRSARLSFRPSASDIASLPRVLLDVGLLA